MKYYLIAGEASGDLHGANLMQEIKALDKNATFRFFGGDLMESKGGSLVKHYREMAFMGFIPVLMNLRTIMSNMRECKNDIKEFAPDVVILIDYPGFNLKIARYVKKKLALPVYYYISPKIWAWKEYRIRSIKRYIDKVFSILPFEVPFYDKYNYKIDYVGNPSVDSIYQRSYQMETFDEFTSVNSLPDKPIIALLPGSRKQEIKSNLKIMVEVASAFGEYQVVIAGAPGITKDFYNSLPFLRNVPVVFDQTYRLLQQSEAALVTSGTATLETALLRVPQIVCYNLTGGWFTYNFIKGLLHIRYISLVNLIAGREVVKELIGHMFSVKSIRTELEQILRNPSYYENMLTGYNEIIHTLGKPGASRNTAKLIVDSLIKK
ncbi:MAG: lipid-A-disaccharide synthase [Candidatus Azobacteroides sp.]|nr:lipid-A-disaccharide synthase [Candidatus Azobacteroides sp.]